MKEKNERKKYNFADKFNQYINMLIYCDRRAWRENKLGAQILNIFWEISILLSQG